MKKYFGWVWFYLMCLMAVMLMATLLLGDYGGNIFVRMLIIAGLGISAWKGGWNLAHPKAVKKLEQR